MSTEAPPVEDSRWMLHRRGFFRAASGGRFGILSVTAFSVVWCIVVMVPLLGLVIWSFCQVEGFRLLLRPTLEAYYRLFDSGRWEVTIRTVRLAFTITALELLIALPFSIWLSKGLRSPGVKALTMALLTVPFFLSMSSRTIVWRSVLGRTGLLNSLLIHLGIVDQPLDWMLFSEFSVYIGLIGPSFPTMVFPMYLAINLIDDEYIEAARDLGGTPWRVFLDVVLPLAMPGIVAGIIFTFVPMLGETVVPALLGGGQVTLLGASIQSLLTILNYSVAAALAVLVLGILAMLLVILRVFLPSGRGIGSIFQGLAR
jgi:spermidine/putrescine transport system permease protein